MMVGIGANVVAFGVVNAVVMTALDVSDSENPYQIRHKAWMSGRLLTTSYPAFEDFRQRNPTFTGMAAFYGYSNAALSSSRNTAIKVSGYEVTDNYFDLLGVQPELGRFFHPAEEHGPNSVPCVVLSNDLWRSAFHADRAVVGTTVELNKHPFTVVGVATAQFHGTEKFRWPDYWIPTVNEEQVEGWDYLHSRTSYVTVIGRLKTGVTPQQATENLNAIAADLAKEYPRTDTGVSLRLIHPGLFGDDGDVIRGFVYGVTVVALLVLAAACANLASLFAARPADRSRELALRVALGSSRWRLARQLLTEAVMVSLMGGAAGLVSADLVLGALNRWVPPLGHLAISADARVYLAGLTLTLASALLFGMLPARQAWHSSPLHAPLGFQPQGAIRAEMDLSQAGQAGDVAVEKEKAMIEAVRSIPGVTAVGTVSRTPMTGGMHGIPVFRPGTTEFKLNNSVLPPYVFTMSPGYLEAAGTRLFSGRDVSWHDTTKTPYVAIVNETFARKMWGETPAIGQRFIVRDNLTEVVGGAENGRHHDLGEPPQA